MGAAVIPVLVFTLIGAAVGLAFPFLLPRGTNRGVAQVVLALTGACCWFFWLCCYMAQMNPLIGPILPRKTLLAMHTYWVMKKAKEE